MFTFAILDPQTTEVLAIIAGMIAGFFAILRFMQTSSDKKIAADQAERIASNKAFVEALEKVATTNQAIANATEKGNREAEKRNGHLAELTIQSKEDTLKAISHLKVQHVDRQTVPHEHVENKA